MPKGKIRIPESKLLSFSVCAGTLIIDGDEVVNGKSIGKASVVNNVKHIYFGAVPKGQLMPSAIAVRFFFFVSFVLCTVFFEFIPVNKKLFIRPRFS